MRNDLTAMILAAGRGERMRPLTDIVPKPLINVRGKPLISHHIEKLAAMGVTRIVINVSYLAEELIATLGRGERDGCEIIYSIEAEALESGGGVATASEHFRGAATVVVSADIYSEFDYKRLIPAIKAIENDRADAHFVMVNPRPGQPGGEFALDDTGSLHEGSPRLTLANIGVLSTAVCHALPRGQRYRLLPHYQAMVKAGRATGELCDDLWWNVTTARDVEILNSLNSLDSTHH
jgi:N-acetyl-alpha-D-muramate 1-phosphate uridylyltransferase